MSKRPQSTERPDIQLDPALPEPLYKQLYDRLRAAILAGQVPRGARLPSTRTLATELGVSRTTTALAYEQLLLEGYLESRVGHVVNLTREIDGVPVDPCMPGLVTREKIGCLQTVFSARFEERWDPD